MKGYMINYEDGKPCYISEIGDFDSITKFAKYLKQFKEGERISIMEHAKIPVKTSITKEEAKKGKGTAYYLIQDLYKPCVYMAEEDSNMFLFEINYKR